MPELTPYSAEIYAPAFFLAALILAGRLAGHEPRQPAPRTGHRLALAAATLALLVALAGWPTAEPAAAHNSHRKTTSGGTR